MRWSVKGETVAEPPEGFRGEVGSAGPTPGADGSDGGADGRPGSVDVAAGTGSLGDFVNALQTR